ncbi:hypothetical protein KTAU_06170 [Thermogemmatispora aurantia]|uniref:Uncharacterized protein n=1 Tax=Thermogemmatispora aurantia TaxID=2045279 RepID=A0A5J4K5N6_9CHLR|nr:hypothetical protein KTAU_06170 [Thermogemmatispora aurantia]
MLLLALSTPAQSDGVKRHSIFHGAERVGEWGPTIQPTAGNPDRLQSVDGLFTVCLSSCLSAARQTGLSSRLG